MIAIGTRRAPMCEIVALALHIFVANRLVHCAA